MESPIRSTGAPWRERAVLGLGIASSLALVAAALAPLGDPAVAARAELARIAGTAADGLVTEWALLLRAQNPPVEPASAMFEWTAADRDASEPTRERDEPSVTPGAAELLLMEAERAQLMRGDAAEALGFVEEALLKSPRPALKARALVRAIQLGTRLKRADSVRAFFAEALRSIDDAAVVDGTSALALARLAAGDVLDADARGAACERLTRARDADTLVLPGEESRLVLRDTSHELVDDPRRAAFEDMLEEACPSGGDPRAWDRRRELGALRALVGALPVDAREDAWSLEPARDALLLVRAKSNERVRGCLVLRAAVEERLQALVRERGLLERGVALDPIGDRAELGTALRPPVDLVPGVLSFTLRHRDPAALARVAEQRAAWLRVGFLALAGLSALAGALAYRALWRERRLHDLQSRFVANVSHELRTPVASILLLAENLEHGRAAPESVARYHAAIRGEALRLRRLVDDVLDFSRLERGKPIGIQCEDTDVEAWARELESDARELAARQGLEFVFRARDLPASASIDREALRRVLVNLVDNAAKHSGSPAVEVELQGRGAMLVLAVRDRGRGIPATRRRQAFEPFARLERDGAPGAGLGLAIVREIAHAHGGDAVIRDPDDGAGTIVEVRVRTEKPKGTP